MPGAGWVDDSDLVLFTPTSLGEHTAGTFSLFFNGSRIGLTHSGEDIDAVEIDGDDLYLSTSGNFKLGDGLKGKDEDVFACRGFTTAGRGSSCDDTGIVFDGSRHGLTSTSQEDVDAFALTPGGNAPDERAFFSTTGNYRTRSTSGGESDIFSCRFPEFDDGLDPEPTPTNFNGDLSDCGVSLSPLETVFRADRHFIDSDVMAIAFPSREVDDEA